MNDFQRERVQAVVDTVKGKARFPVPDAHKIVRGACGPLFDSSPVAQAIRSLMEDCA